MRRVTLIAALLVVLLGLAFLLVEAADAHVAKPHVTVRLAFSGCPGHEDDEGILGCYFEQPAGVYNIYWRDHDPITLSHEIGHVFDATVLQDRQRAAFTALFDLDGLGWWDTFLPNGASPGEWFAEAYARCDRHIPALLPTAYDYDPTRAQHRAVCRLIWNADRDRL